MKITYKRATKHHSKVFRALAANALKAKLYIPGWMLFPELDMLVNYPEHRSINPEEVIVVAYDNNKPVGICIMACGNGGILESMTFVRKRYRRSGIGSQLIKRALGKRSKFVYGTGAVLTKDFFKKFKGAEFDEYLNR